MDPKQPAARVANAKNTAKNARFSRNLRQSLVKEIAHARQRRTNAQTAVEKRICTIQIHAMRATMESLRQGEKLPTGKQG